MTRHRRQESEEAIRRWDRVFEALSAAPRRHLVDELMDVPDGGTVSLPEAAVPAVIERDPEAFQIELHHRHLPLLADAGFVEWQRTPFQAAPGPQFDEVAVVLEALYANAGTVPEHLVPACRTLEREYEREREQSEC
ncbi:hypothetical protein [Halopiger xanaduensis]|uniref:Transcriptional regulator n=1 Tax=Halopiger xanaduensis (strain DSM 18323 / JCM 14033 / SH-6) TaxID=797210 RepID=F8D6V6_HALXS|nr:hypothetical protein [Halopiger xanaduensis]AEH35917.1 hypothetical protein Halxa_1284 [Halopiger xanaduensis SH-6]